MTEGGLNQRKWHVNREVSVGDLIVMLGAVVGILLTYGKLDTRVSLVEQTQVTVKADQVSIKSDMSQTTNRLEVSISEINHKLDRLIERGNK